jgi:hypothetical protein
MAVSGPDFHQAFAELPNSVAAQLTEVGPGGRARGASAGHHASPLAEVSSLALGVRDVELTGAYTPFPMAATVCLRCAVGRSESSYRRTSRIGGVMSANDNMQMTRLMLEVTATGPAGRLDRPPPPASSPRTSATLVCRFTDLVCGVWIAMQ